MGTENCESRRVGRFQIAEFDAIARAANALAPPICSVQFADGKNLRDPPKELNCDQRYGGPERIERRRHFCDQLGETALGRLSDSRRRGIDAVVTIESLFYASANYPKAGRCPDFGLNPGR